MPVLLIRIALGNVSGDVDDTARETRSRAYPQSLGEHIGTCPVGAPEGPCGGELWTSHDPTSSDGATDDRWARCLNCKASGLVDFWLAQMPAEATEWLPLRALRWRLLLHIGRKVPDAIIHAWAGDPEVLPTRRVSAAVEYRVPDVLELARTRLAEAA
jgi:hypothetical protein